MQRSMSMGVCKDGVCTLDYKQLAPGHVDAISEVEFRLEVLESELPVIVEFHRPDNCGRCRAARPQVERLAEEYDRFAKVVTIDVDQNQRLAERYGVGPLPHFVLISDGETVSVEKPTLIPGEARKRQFTSEQLVRLFEQVGHC